MLTHQDLLDVAMYISSTSHAFLYPYNIHLLEPLLNTSLHLVRAYSALVVMDRPLRPQSMTGRRPHLRDVYTKKLSDIIRSLDSNKEPAEDIISRDRLKRLGVTLESFDPNDQGFINSEACLFAPLSEDVRQEFSLRDPEASKGGSYIFREFDKLFKDPTGFENPSDDLVLEYRARDIFHYVERLYDKSIRVKGEDDDEYLNEFSHWDQIK